MLGYFGQILTAFLFIIFVKFNRLFLLLLFIIISFVVLLLIFARFIQSF